LKDTSVAIDKLMFNWLVQCSGHIHVEVPTPFTQVTALLDSIECDNDRLQAALSLIPTDANLTGLHHNFERAGEIILPQDPVALKQTTNKRNATAMVSAVDVPNDTELKVGTGKTGVALRYVKLRRDQKLELTEHHNEPERQGFGRLLPGEHGTPPKKSHGNKK
jgi:hypothetical protein